MDAGSIRVVSDGTTLMTVVEPVRKYTEAPAAATIGPDTFVDNPLGAILFGGDGLAAAIGAGTRDPAVTAAFAIAAGLAGAAAVPLAYTALVVLSLAVGKLLVPRQA